MRFSSIWFSILRISVVVFISSSFLLVSSLLRLSLFSSKDVRFFDASLSSMSLISSLSFLYLSAFFACLSMEFICLFISLTMSFTRRRFWFVDSSLFIASFRLILNFIIPAVSSIITLLSVGFELSISSILPCSIIVCAFAPMPLSIKRSLISFNLHGILFMKYSLSPER